MKKFLLNSFTMIVLLFTSYFVTGQDLVDANIAPNASVVEAHYTSAWNNLSAINNGVVGYGIIAAENGLPNDETWGCWRGDADRTPTGWLAYEWDDEYDIDKVIIYFWIDVEDENAGNGVALPQSYVIQYWDSGIEDWVDVTLTDGTTYPRNAYEPNEVTFNSVTTSKLRLFMNATTDGSTYAALGVTEWEVYAQITPSASLDSLSSSVGELTREGEDYILVVPYGTTSVQLTPVVNGIGATVEMYYGAGFEAVDGVIPFDGDGIDVEIIVTALDGAQFSYYVAIDYGDGQISADLSSISLSIGEVSDFDVNTLNYSVLLPYGTTSVEVTGIPAWGGATVNGNGTVNIVDGAGTAILEVVSENGENSKEYTIEFANSHVDYGEGKFYYFVQEVSGYVIGESPEDDPEGSFLTRLYAPVYNNESQLFELIPSGVDNQYFIRNKEGKYVSHVPTSNWLMMMIDDLTIDLDSCRFQVNEFEPGRFRIESVIRLGQGSRFWGTTAPESGIIVVGDRPLNDGPRLVWNILTSDEVVDPVDNSLSELSVDVAGMKPEFDGFIKEYNVTLPVGTTSFTITAQANDPAATVTGGGEITVSGEEGTATVTVANVDPETSISYSREFTIHYRVDKPLTLRHAYTFADGTANDSEGTADGVVNAGSFVDGAFVAAAEGDYITLPADEIALKNYTSITLEAYVLTGFNPGWTMFAYFGELEGDSTYWMSIARADDVSKTAINLGNRMETGPTGFEPAEGEEHHYVSVLSYDSLALYIDGTLADKVAVPSSFDIADISEANAWICKGGYGADPTWIGSVYEFNIYEGKMDSAMVAERAATIPTAVIENKIEADAAIYPTISSDGTFKFVTGGNSGMLTVYNLTGAVVKQMPVNTGTTTFSLQKSQMYIVRAEVDRKLKIFKIIRK